jgi:mannose-1-phosphate guanylyltransferase/phosphomannomutase
MVPVGNKPMAEHVVNLLKKHDFRDIIFALHYLPDAIRDHFSDGSEFGANISYSIEEGKPLGTAGCVKMVQDHLDSTFVVISGDSLTDIDLSAALKFHKEKKSKATLILKRVENPLDYGVVICDNDQRIQRFVEKPGASEIFSDTVNTGTYILEPEVLLYIVMGREQDFSNDLFPLLLLRNEPMYGYVADGYWCDIGNLAVYRQAHKDVLDGLVNVEIDLPQIQPGIWVGQGTQIDSSVKLEAPVMIGKNCRIGRETEISPHTTLGDNVGVQEKATLKQPVVWSNVYIGAKAALRACVVCNNSTIHSSASLLEGAIIGDNSSIGQEATIKSDVRIWPDKNVDSGAKVLSSLIWGTRAPRTLFGAHGVRGVALGVLDMFEAFAMRQTNVIAGHIVLNVNERLAAGPHFPERPNRRVGRRSHWQIELDGLASQRRAGVGAAVRRLRDPDHPRAGAHRMLTQHRRAGHEGREPVMPGQFGL